MVEKIIILSLVGAAIGWLTNYLAIRMLFRPYRRIKVGPFYVQGLLPKRREEVAASIARTVENELLSKEDITGVLEKIDFEESIRVKVNSIIEQRLTSDFLKKLPLFEQVKENILLPLKEKLLEELMKIVKNYQSKLIDGFSEEIDLEKIVYEKINGFDLRHLEKVILEVAGKELKSIELLGAVLGFMIAMFHGIISGVI